MFALYDLSLWFSSASSVYDYLTFSISVIPMRLFRALSSYDLTVWYLRMIALYNLCMWFPVWYPLYNLPIWFFCLISLRDFSFHLLYDFPILWFFYRNFLLYFCKWFSLMISFEISLRDILICPSDIWTQFRVYPVVSLYDFPVWYPNMISPCNIPIIFSYNSL